MQKIQNSKTKQNKKKGIECGHLLEPASEGSNRFTDNSLVGIHLPIFRQEVSSIVTATTPAV